MVVVGDVDASSLAKAQKVGSAKRTHLVISSLRRPRPTRQAPLGQREEGCVLLGQEPMYRFSRLSATPSTLNAQLFDDERIIEIQDGVGLYDGYEYSSP
jgi:hypothetical protein